MSEESLAEYTDRVIPSWWEKLEPPEWVEYYIRRALELLDAVPRDDPFWAKTNQRATRFKAGLWFRSVLEANPDDAEARWILASFGLKGCGMGLEALIAPLVVQDPSNLRRLVGATAWVWYMSGADYTVALRHELSMLQNDPAVRSLLEAPAGNDELGRAVQVALNVLAGNSIAVAVEGLTGQ